MQGRVGGERHPLLTHREGMAVDSHAPHLPAFRHLGPYPRALLAKAMSWWQTSARATFPPPPPMAARPDARCRNTMAHRSLGFPWMGWSKESRTP